MTLLQTRRPPDVRRARPDLLRWTAWIAVILVCAARLPFLAVPAGPDEGGYLLVASQWSPGRSLYGDYWVDRPPLLLAIHALAAGLGGIVPLRLLGLVAAVATVLLAAGLARLAAADRGRTGSAVGVVAPVVVAAALVASPLLGATEVDGELLSLPLVLAAVLATLRALHAPTVRGATGWGLAAGAAAVAAALVKQNAVDGFVAAACLVLLARGVAGGRRRVAAALGAGATVTLLTVLVLAALRGTGPAALVDAVVTFRVQAAAVIHRSSSGASSTRLVGLVRAAVASGAPVVAAVLAARVRRAPAAGRTGRGQVDLRWPAYALLGWEVLSIAGGGSYWRHYLLVLVPGLVVLAAAAAQRPSAPARALAGALALLVGSTALATTQAVARPAAPGADDRVVSYLREHAAPGDTVVVGFGHPDIVWRAGISSPYPELWSLPVRVRDPWLRGFDAVLRSTRAPTWVVVSGRSLFTWGVDATAADRTLRAEYVPVASVGGFGIWRLAVRPGGP